MSIPIISAGISVLLTVLCGASLSNSGATTVSTGKRSFTPRALASSISCFARSMFSSSRSDFPISQPIALKKVYAIPPPISRVSHFVRRFLITPILSFTLAPPNIATKGRSGFETAPSRKRSSFSIKKPQADGKNSATPAVEACAL